MAATAASDVAKLFVTGGGVSGGMWRHSTSAGAKIVAAWQCRGCYLKNYIDK